MAAPNAKELEALQAFRAKVADVEEELPIPFRTDIMMMTWLRARSLNVNQAEEMLRKSIEWRKEHDIYNLHKWKPEKDFLKQFYFELSGYTTDGCPVIIVPLGKWDIRKAMEDGDKELFLKYINYMFSFMIEICIQRTTLPNKIVSQFVCIVDTAGFTLRQVTLMAVVETVVEAAKRFEANFPESLKQCFVINAPRIFPLCFAIVKPILSANTVEKIQIFGPNQKKWKNALKSHIPADQYPQKYGGTKVLAAGSGLDNVISLDRNNSDDGSDELISVTISAGDTFEIAFDITSTTTLLSWAFKTDDYDIGFLIKRDEKEIRPMEKCQSHLEKQEGSFLCNEVGRYTLAFDNSYSRLRSKTLYYMINVTSDSADDEDEWTSL